MAGEEIVSTNFVRVSYAATVHPSVCPFVHRCRRDLVKWWVADTDFDRFESLSSPQVSNSSGVLTWLLVTLPAPAIFLGTTSRNSLDDPTPDSGSILEDCYRRGNGRTMTSPLTNGMSFGGKEGVARTSEIVCLRAICSSSLETHWEQGTHLSRSLHAPWKVLYGRRDRSDWERMRLKRAGRDEEREQEKDNGQEENIEKGKETITGGNKRGGGEDKEWQNLREAQWRTFNVIRVSVYQSEHGGATALGVPKTTGLRADGRASERPNEREERSR